MMKSWKNRILGVIVCVALVLGTVSVPAFADELVVVDPIENTQSEEENAITIDQAEENDEGSSAISRASGEVDTSDFDPTSGDVLDVNAEWTFEEQLEVAKRMTLSTMIEPDGYTLDFENNAVPLRSGDTIDVMMMLMYQSAGALTAKIDPQKLTATVSVPAGMEGAVASNTFFTFLGRDGDSESGYKYTFRFNAVPGEGAGGSGTDITMMYVTTPNNGMIPNGQVGAFHTEWKYGDVVLNPDEEVPYVFTTDQFSWTSYTGSPKTATITAPTEDGVVPDFTINVSITNANNDAKKTGRSLTKQLVFDNIFEVHDDLLVTKSDLDTMVWTYGTQTLTGTNEILTYQAGSTQYVKTFKTTVAIDNSALIAGTSKNDIGNIVSNLKVVLKGFKVNTEKVNEANDPSKLVTLTVKVLNTGVAKAYPYVTIADTTNGNVRNDLEMDGTQQYQKITRNTTSTQNISYTTPAEEIVIIDDPWESGNIVKTITQKQDSLGKTTTNSSDLMYAYYSDRITYRFTGFGNTLDHTDLKEYIISDEFDMEALYPIEIYTGAYKNGKSGQTFKVRIYTKKNGQETLAYESNNYNITTSSSTLTVANLKDSSNNAIDPYDVSKVEWVFTEVSPNFQPNSTATAPGMMMGVRNMGTRNPVQGDPTDKLITNTAEVSFKDVDEDDAETEYSYSGLDAQGKEKANNFRSESIITYYGNGVANEKGAKTFQKVNGANPTNGKVVKDDILEYKIQFRNISGQEAKNPFFDDYYTGLEPYIEDTLNYGIEEQGYGDPPFVEVVKVYDENGKDVTADRGLKLQGVYVGPIEYEDNVPGAYFYSKGKEPDIVANMWRVRFTSTNHIQPGETIEVTYLMRVTDPDNITNRFEGWGYPVEEGDEQLLPFTGGENKHDPDTTVDTIKPTISITQTIVKTGTTTAPVNTNPLSVGESVDITVKLQNSSEKRPPAVNVDGFSFAFYTYYADIMKYNKNQTVEVKVYDVSGGDSNPVVLQTIQGKLTDAPAGMNTHSTYKNNYNEKAAILFDEPIQLSRSQYIQFTIQATLSEASSVATNNYEQHYAFALMKEGTADYTTSNTSGAATWTTNMASFIRTTANSIYLQSKAQPIAHLYPYVSTSQTTPYGFRRDMNLNNTQRYWNRLRQRVYTDKIPATGNNLSATSFLYYVNFSNASSQTLTFEKIYVRMPVDEEFISVYSPTTFTGTPIGVYGTGEDTYQVVEISYNNGTYTLAPNTSLPTIYLQSKMSEEAAEKYIKEHEQRLISGTATTGQFQNSAMQLAIYSSTGFTHTTAAYAWNTLTTEQDLAKWGGSDLGVDLSNGFFQESIYTIPGYYRVYYAQPGVQINSWKEKDGVLVQNVNDAEAYSPGERMAWGITANLGGTVDTHLMSLDDPAIVVKLPADTTYTGIVEDAYNDIATLFDSADGYQYVIVPINKDLTASVVSFKLTAALGGLYGNKIVEAYLVSEQFFYEVNSGTRVNTNSLTGDVREKLPFNPSMYAVTNTNTARVTGRFNFSTTKEINEVSGGSTKIDRGVKAAYRDQQTVKYILSLNNQSGGSGTTSLAYQNVTFIERLPEIGDKFIVSDDLTRGSTTTLHLNGRPTVLLYELDKDTGTQLGTKNEELGNFTIEYAAVGTDYDFTGVDFGFDSGTSQAGWIAVDNWPADKQPTAFRIRFENQLRPNRSLQVTFEADAPSEYMPKLDAVAVNTFAAAFECQSGSTKYQLTPEADYVRVVFPDIPEMVIEGTVFIEDAATADGVYDPATETYFSDFENGKVFLDLYWFGILENGQEDTGEIIKTYQLNNNNGTYRFDGIYDEGFYYVGIRGIPDGYEIFDQIKLEELQGNKFHHSNGMTDQIPYVAGTTYIRNAGIVERINGTLTLEKKLRTSLFATDSGLVGGKPQTFVFRIDYTPLGGTVPTRTFYEVLHGDESKTIVDLPQGRYDVTEVEGWAMDYVQVGDTSYKSNVNTITRQTQNIEALISNTRDQKPFFHAIAEAVNSGFDRKKAN